MQDFWLEDYALFMAVKAEQRQAGLADWPDALRCRRAGSHWPPPGPGWRSRWTTTRPCSSSSTPSGTPSRPMPTQRASSWWAISPSTSARIPATCGPTRSCSRPTGTVHLTQVAGCPPDAFAADGQLWGNPLYDWPNHQATGFAWWKQPHAARHLHLRRGAHRPLPRL